MDMIEAMDRLADDIDAAIVRAQEAGLLRHEIAECLRDIAHNLERGIK